MHPTFFSGVLGFFSIGKWTHVDTCCHTIRFFLSKADTTVFNLSGWIAHHLLLPCYGQVLIFYVLNIYIHLCREKEMSGRGWGRKDSDARRNRGKMPFQTQVAILFFSRGNGLKLKLNSKLMKHILVVTFVSEVINYLHQPCSQQFLSVN